MDRRRFVRALPVVAGAAAGCGALLTTACGGAAYLVPVIAGGRLLVPSEQVGPGGVFVALPRDERPLFVSRDGDGRPVAVHARCTHRGCLPEPVAGRLVCPCHGSEFTLGGEVLEGPAREALRRFVAEEEGGSVVIHLPGGGR